VLDPAPRHLTIEKNKEGRGLLALSPHGLNVFEVSF
jgi:hypothetical protein